MRRLGEKFEQLKKERNGRGNDAFAKRLQNQVRPIEGYHQFERSLTSQCQKWYFGKDVYFSLYKQWESQATGVSSQNALERGSVVQVTGTARRRRTVAQPGLTAPAISVAAAPSPSGRPLNSPAATTSESAAAPLLHTTHLDAAIPTVQGARPEPTAEQVVAFLTQYSELKDSCTAIDFIGVICIDVSVEMLALCFAQSLTSPADCRAQSSTQNITFPEAFGAGRRWTITSIKDFSRRSSSKLLDGNRASALKRARPVLDGQSDVLGAGQLSCGYQNMFSTMQSYTYASPACIHVRPTLYRRLKQREIPILPVVTGGENPSGG